MSRSDVYFRIRSTRARPPAHAIDDGRREVYSAALEQFDELMSGAAVVGRAARPLPLFYALSQAGRAICAARAPERWILRQHGLSAPRLGDVDLRDLEIRPSPRRVNSGEIVDSFSGVAEATGSGCPSDTITLGSVWAALPEIQHLLPEDSVPEPRWRRALQVVSLDDLSTGLVAWGQMNVAIAGVPVDETGALILEERYPAAQDFVPSRIQTGLPIVGVVLTSGETAMRGSWPVPEKHRDLRGHATVFTERTTPNVLEPDSYWISPAVAGARMSSLMGWWALLFGLSMFARYEPAGWRNALDYDRSELAAPLGEVLDVGLEAVPELVLDAIGSV